MYIYIEKMQNYCESIPIGVEKRIEYYSAIKSFIPEFDRSFLLKDSSDENKERVPFYMSILTTMQFMVRGKSVDFRNREGSSPSIPKQKPILLLNFSSRFFDFIRSSVQTKFTIFPIHPTFSQKNPNQNSWILSQF